MDLIDRQAAIDAFCKECYDTDGEICNRDDVCGNVMILKGLPSAQPEVGTQMSSSDTISRQDVLEAYEKIGRAFNALGLDCAYDMPSFWCNGKKDYRVIPTKYHKGYQKALEDAEKKVKEILEELCYG